VGATTPVKIAIRIVATTNRDLKKRGRRRALPLRPVLSFDVIELHIPRCVNDAKTFRCWWTTLSGANNQR